MGTRARTGGCGFMEPEAPSKPERSGILGPLSGSPAGLMALYLVLAEGVSNPQAWGS